MRTTGTNFKTALRQIENEVPRSRFTPELLKQAKKVGSQLPILASTGHDENEEISNLRCRCLIAEVFDYYGETRSVQQVVQAGAALYNELPRSVQEQASGKRSLFREKVRLILYYAQSIYRDGQYTAARDLILDCQSLLTDDLFDQREPVCYELLGQSYYYLGRVYRHLNQLADAEDAFGKSIEHYYLLTETRKALYSQSKGRNRDKKVLDSFIYSAHRIAKSQALGLGWINHTRGYYRRALLHNIYPARVLFTFAADKLNVARLNLLLSLAK